MKFTCSVLTAALVLGVTPFGGNCLVVTKNTSSPKTSGKNVFRFSGRCHLGQGRRMADTSLFLSPEDLTNYMAKAHEDKIRALKEIEDKKNAEIKVRTTFLH